ncbi:hypothetical protein SLEP1_g59947 [Rubroshorea leprosula]|uniref:Uncharacterized protein n=1 Tax=Rubroshorea leprosula TaxID=152421 RepID=A0AAV5MV71_9ROSI|nr:hypothetical protein SLEP1_g59947 [Rubroshorea leprosula]
MRPALFPEPKPLPPAPGLASCTSLALHQLPCSAPDRLHSAPAIIGNHAPAAARLHPCTPMPCTLLRLHLILHSCFCQKAGSFACCAPPAFCGPLHADANPARLCNPILYVLCHSRNPEQKTKKRRARLATPLEIESRISGFHVLDS